MKTVNPINVITAYDFEDPVIFSFLKPKKELILIKWKIAPNTKIGSKEATGTTNIDITA